MGDNTEMTAAARPASGLFVGSVIALVFGLVFVEVNSGGLASPWPLVIRLAGVVVAIALFAAVFRAERKAGDSVRQGTWFDTRRYWVIVALEAIALFGGLAVINLVLHQPKIAVAWIAFVVGVHFFGLAAAFRLARFHVLGAAQTLLGIAGFVLAATGADAGTIGLVSGVLSGVALFVTVAVSLKL